MIKTDKVFTRAVSVDRGYSPDAQRQGQLFGTRKPLENKGETNYATVLLQCLYHLPHFKTLLFEYERQNEREMKLIGSMLAKFFESMDKTTVDFANESADELIQYVSNKYDVKIFYFVEIYSLMKIGKLSDK